MAARGVLGGQSTFGYGAGGTINEGLNAEGFSLNSDFPDLTIGEGGLQVAYENRNGMGSRKNSQRMLQKENSDGELYKGNSMGYNNFKGTFGSNGTPKDSNNQHTLGGTGTVDIDFINQKNENRLKRLENFGLKTVNEDEEMRNRGGGGGYGYAP